MSAAEPAPAAQIDQAFKVVAGRIAARYGTPFREAHIYVFWVHPGTDLQGMTVTPVTVIRAWLDDGDKLAEHTPAEAIRRYDAARANPPGEAVRGPEKRRRMARIAQFSMQYYVAEDGPTVDVSLFSQYLHIDKGRRTVREIWKRNPAGEWYSAYRPDDD